jgi:hypothetical protein
VEPSGAELQDLFSTFGFVLTEEQSVPESGIRDIDPEQFREFLRRLGIGPPSSILSFPPWCSRRLGG